jgi:uncharacterized integral membrane protein
MAKDSKPKAEKVIESVTLKDVNEVITTRSGLVINAENLTVERYLSLIALSDSFKEKFNVKLTNKQNEQSNEVGS